MSKDKKAAPGPYTELHIDFTVPPPIYGDHLTIIPERAQRTVKLVSKIECDDGIFFVTSVEGVTYAIPQARVKFFKRD